LATEARNDLAKVVAEQPSREMKRRKKKANTATRRLAVDDKKEKRPYTAVTHRGAAGLNIVFVSDPALLPGGQLN
jgi:hypothetical protein